MKSLLKISCIIGILQACGSTTNQTNSLNITGGDLVSNLEDPVAKHTVALVFGIDTFCTGNLIAKDWVLTAAHCIESYVHRNSLVALRFGHSLLPRSQQISAVGTPHLHPLFPLHGDEYELKPNDIGLIHIQASDGPYDFIKPVNIAKSNAFNVNDDVIIAGFGRDAINFTEPQGSLKRANVLVEFIDEENSTITYRAENDINSSCHGDSGGPMYIESQNGLELIAITRGADSSSERSIKCLGRGIYTNILPYLDWIDVTIKESEARIKEEALAREQAKPPGLRLNIPN